MCLPSSPCLIGRTNVAGRSDGPTMLSPASGFPCLGSPQIRFLCSYHGASGSTVCLRALQRFPSLPVSLPGSTATSRAYHCWRSMGLAALANSPHDSSPVSFRLLEPTQSGSSTSIVTSSYTSRSVGCRVDVALYLSNGVIVPSWVKPDEQLSGCIRRAVAVERPWYYPSSSSLCHATGTGYRVGRARDHNAWHTITGQVALVWFATILSLSQRWASTARLSDAPHRPCCSCDLWMVLVILLTVERPML